MQCSCVACGQPIPGFGGLKWDVDLGYAERHGAHAYLSKRQTQLFALLFLHRTRPVTLDQIIARMVDDDDGDKTLLPTTVRTHIHLLNKLLAPLHFRAESVGQTRYVLVDLDETNRSAAA